MSKKTVCIRGAATAINTRESIAASTLRLIDGIYFKNSITDDDVVNILITVDNELTAFSPARAIREAGHNVALACTEPDTDVGISGCIRVTVTAQSEHPVFHVYHGGARALGKDLTEHYSIALDGPSGAGKSTVAKAVAKKLKITYLDTGALYRALGLTCLNNKVDMGSAWAVEQCLRDVKVALSYKDGVQRVAVDGDDVTEQIRSPEVSMAASAVSAVPFVRQKLLGIQRDIATDSSVILDGRDIGTVVLPSAEFKFYLTASAEIRAKRRFDELTAKGRVVVYDEVLNDVVTRDRNDSTRSVAPLKQAYDAVKIDSDDMSAEQVIAFVVRYVEERLK